MFNNLTWEQIKSILKPEAFVAFQKYMEHQTVALDNGVERIYSEDLGRWVWACENRGELVTSQFRSDWD